MLGVDQNLVNQVTQMSNNYSQDINGLIKAINENGGMSKVDEAMRYVNNPIVKKGLSMLGISANDINNAYNQVKNVPMAQNKPTSTNSYTERLNRLKR